MPDGLEQLLKQFAFAPGGNERAAEPLPLARRHLRPARRDRRPPRDDSPTPRHRSRAGSSRSRSSSDHRDAKAIGRIRTAPRKADLRSDALRAPGGLRRSADPRRDPLASTASFPPPSAATPSPRSAAASRYRRRAARRGRRRQGPRQPSVGRPGRQPPQPERRRPQQAHRASLGHRPRLRPKTRRSSSPTTSACSNLL